MINYGFIKLFPSLRTAPHADIRCEMGLRVLGSPNKRKMCRTFSLLVTV